MRYNNFLNGGKIIIPATTGKRDGRDGKRSVTKIDFDIAVIVSKEENKKADGSINIQVLKVGGNASKLDANQTTSRLSFSIDVALPEVE